ncbi:hypothetical protein ACWC09_40850 [Streptomyces sp. NPDC001617]
MTANSYVFYGSEPQFVLIVAGIHESEQSGIEVAHWIRTKLAARSRPTRFGAVVVPDVFPQRGVAARTEEWRSGDASGSREVRIQGQTLFPARHFPPPGQPLSALKNGLLIDRNGVELRIAKQTVPQLAEIRYVIQFVEQFKPVRIVSVHGKRPRTRDDLKSTRAQNGLTDKQIKDWDEVTAIKGTNFPGIFVDPRYQLGKDCPQFDLEPCKFDSLHDPAFPTLSEEKDQRFDSARTDLGRKDDALCLKAAKAVAALDATLVRGNHVAEPLPVVHYAKEGGTPQAFSLGDWGPVDVAVQGLGTRSGAPVFTIEVKDDNESWAFLDGVQVVDEKGDPLIVPPTPEERAAGNKGRKFVKSPGFTKRFSQKRSRELQNYAQGIIDTILELP